MKSLLPRPGLSWSASALPGFVLAILTAAPILVLASSIFQPLPDLWEHLGRYVLMPALSKTVQLTLGVCLGTFVIGTLLASLTGLTEFPGRNFFDRALILPLAMPAYVFAFIYVGSLEYSGPVAVFLRSAGLDLSTLLPIRSFGGVVAVMSLAFYPYVYLTVRQCFLSQSQSIVESARVLGISGAGLFFKVLLPAARPWIAGGVGLTAMETVADFGTVSVFNYDTLTSAIYKAWFGFFSLTGAAQISTMLFSGVLLLILLEKSFGRGARFWLSGKKSVPLQKIRLRGAAAFSAFGVCSLVFLLGFCLPVIQLILWSLRHLSQDFDSRYWTYFGRTAAVSASAAILITLAGLALAYSARRHRSLGMRFLVSTATLGYAVPGAVLAVGVVIVCAHFDRALSALIGGVLSSQPLMTQSVLLMQLAYLVRFLRVSFAPLESAMERLPVRYDETARILGMSGKSILAQIHIPLLKSGLLTSAVLVFVEVMKELPMTLMTRPFGWETLAVRIFEMTSEGEWERAALPSLVLVFCGFLPLLLLPKDRPDGANLPEALR